MLSKHAVDVTFLQQSDIGIRTIVAIGQHNIVGFETVPHRAKQSVFACFLSFARTNGHFQSRSAGNAKDHHQAGKRESNTWLLRFWLRILFLIFWRIRHRDRGTVHRFDPAAVKEPLVRDAPLQPPADALDQNLKQFFRQPLTRAAVRIRIRRTRTLTFGDAERQQSGNNNNTYYQWQRCRFFSRSFSFSSFCHP